MMELLATSRKIEPCETSQSKSAYQPILQENSICLFSSGETSRDSPSSSRSGMDLLRFFVSLRRLVPKTDFMSIYSLLKMPHVKILYPADYLPTTNPAQVEVIDNFVKGLETALQISRTHISLAEEWKKDYPDGPEHPDIAEYLKLVGLKHSLISTTNLSSGRRRPFLL
jgi:hypothetical protein